MTREMSIRDRDLARLAEGRCSAREAAALRERIRNSDEARARFDALAEAQRQLDGAGPGEVGLAGRERMAARLFAELPSAKVKRPRFRWWVPGLAAAGAAWALSFGPLGGAAGNYTSRGTEAGLAVDAGYRLQVLRIRLVDEDLEIVPADVVRPGDALRFALRMSDRSRKFWLHAVPEKGEAQALSEAKALESELDLVRLDVPFEVPETWAGQEVRFVAQFGSAGDPATAQASDNNERSVRLVRVRVETP